MAIELITGRAGTPHVDSFDVGAFNAATLGEGIYILSGAVATLADANNVNISAGELLCEGRHVRITGTGENLAIDNGTSAYKRNDIVAVKYLRDGDGIESATLVVIKGTPAVGTPADPEMPTSGKVLENASEAYWPLYRIAIYGLAPQEPERITDNESAIFADDYVVEHGESGPWIWDRYASGLVSLYGCAGFKVNQQETWTNQWQSLKQTMSLPFSIYQILGVSSHTAGSAQVEVSFDNFYDIDVPKNNLHYLIYAAHNLIPYYYDIHIHILAR